MMGYGSRQTDECCRVRVTQIPVEHEVKLSDFTKWLERRGRFT